MTTSLGSDDEPPSNLFIYAFPFLQLFKRFLPFFLPAANENVATIWIQFKKTKLCHAFFEKICPFQSRTPHWVRMFFI
jgi:hypothetical protein